MRAAALVRRQARAPLSGTWGALVMFWLSLTPSLLPRSPMTQSLVAAVSALVGYGLGSLLGWMVRSSGGRLDAAPARRTAWRVTGVVGLVGTVVALWLHAGWENDLRAMVGVDSAGAGDVLVAVLVGALLFVLVLLAARGLKAVGRRLGRPLGRILPARVAMVVGGLVVALVTYVLVTGVGAGRALSSLDAIFMAANDEFSTELPAPTSPQVSAGPRSGVTWDELGRQGRVFIAHTPTAAAIEDFTGRAARQPVRAYVGVGSDREVDLREEAQRAVDELERTGGFDREVLNVATGTGRGWVNENQARALEYMWDGDTATVSIQYSYLPSWLSFLVDRERAQDAGRLLFDAVYGRWLELPRRDRPLLVVSGESLGSFGGEAAFSGAQDLANRVDGALFVGPTNNNVLWSRFTAERDAGTPEVLPVYDAGATVRFADRPSDWEAPGDDWSGARIGYLQHANDPITWWDWSLALERPDWLEEPRGRDVSPAIRWIPCITMLQLGADQMIANAVPDGQGHEFGQEPVYAWAEILSSPGWTDADTERLAAVIAAQRAADFD